MFSVHEVPAMTLGGDNKNLGKLLVQMITPSSNRIVATTS